MTDRSVTDNGLANMGSQAPHKLQADTLVSSRLFKFINLLRVNGFNLSANDIHAAHQVISDGALTSEEHLHNSLRTIFCQSKSQWQMFPILFQILWRNPLIDKGQTNIDTNDSTQRESTATGSVSYTHLTLPTICSV